MSRSVLEIEELASAETTWGTQTSLRISYMDESLRTSTRIWAARVVGTFGNWEFISDNHPEIRERETNSGEWKFFLLGSNVRRDREVMTVPREIFEEMVVAIGELNGYYQDRDSLYNELFERLEDNV